MTASLATCELKSMATLQNVGKTECLLSRSQYVSQFLGGCLLGDVVVVARQANSLEKDESWVTNSVTNRFPTYKVCLLDDMWTMNTLYPCMGEFVVSPVVSIISITRCVFYISSPARFTAAAAEAFIYDGLQQCWEFPCLSGVPALGLLPFNLLLLLGCCCCYHCKKMVVGWAYFVNFSERKLLLFHVIYNYVLVRSWILNLLVNVLNRFDLWYGKPH